MQHRFLIIIFISRVTFSDKKGRTRSFRIAVRNLKTVRGRASSFEPSETMTAKYCERSRARSFPRASVNAGRQSYRNLPATETYTQHTLLVKQEKFSKLPLLTVNVTVIVSVKIMLSRNKE